jgi:hypothetical protein
MPASHRNRGYHSPPMVTIPGHMNSANTHLATLRSTLILSPSMPSFSKWYVPCIRKGRSWRRGRRLGLEQPRRGLRKFRWDIQPPSSGLKYHKATWRHNPKPQDHRASSSRLPTRTVYSWPLIRIPHAPTPPHPPPPYTNLYSTIPATSGDSRRRFGNQQLHSSITAYATRHGNCSRHERPRSLRLRSARSPSITTQNK